MFFLDTVYYLFIFVCFNFSVFISIFFIYNATTKSRWCSATKKRAMLFYAHSFYVLFFQTKLGQLVALGYHVAFICKLCIHSGCVSLLH